MFNLSSKTHIIIQSKITRVLNEVSTKANLTLTHNYIQYIHARETT